MLNFPSPSSLGGCNEETPIPHWRETRVLAFIRARYSHFFQKAPFKGKTVWVEPK
ncbi:hypothetical protein CDL15_Pgr028608 [Punica granatum]|uniref:Uncharacterized protein n=1 Tax=Punica granatum TaxID=22663 RepID=A0A218VY08_PUNGR|nr:hypothetical protein CDL15_Pgr028608 [Punica granatum]